MISIFMLIDEKETNKNLRDSDCICDTLNPTCSLENRTVLGPEWIYY